MPLLPSIHVIDSHTAGEPTRVVVSGGPDLGTGTVAQRCEVFRTRHDRFRSAVVNEPRGSEVVVGALLCEPSDASCLAGVIFFNNVGFLKMCGHGTIGLVVTLARLGRIGAGTHCIETPVGPVTAVLHDDGTVSIDNVPSYRQSGQVVLDVPDLGVVEGDVAWGGNWFFLTGDLGEELAVSNVARLGDISLRIRQAVRAAGYPEVDHVELCGRGRCGGDSRNFVLCPGNAYDRSPCGTGTSAKLACLAAEGQLAPGQVWIQESILGTMFEGRFRWEDASRGRIVPTITGTAYVTAESRLVLDERDPFCWGIRESR
jgi:4-hydroxyproline epimerase